ncbi:hypothetical protein K8P01_18475 [Mycolicibacterium smegmatis]|nr:hypothetical protein K8P01_18475 [Mycolicibacterium smegmatis]ULN70726.1 hypothetical protein KZ782_01795 [Mycolicibacterium smegmatis]CKG91393.1 Hypothetical protein ERS451418_00341 [Mycolicibacterium smegmatis]
MRLRAAVFVTALMSVVLIAAGACGPSGEDSTDEKKAQPPMTPPTELTVTEAARVAAGYVSMILGKPVDPDPAMARKIGCRTDDALMSVGPPWKVQVYEWLVDPAPELVEGALTRIDTLLDEGFEPIPSDRPDQDSPTHKAYRDARGYVVSVKAETTAGGVYGLDVHATSPCADEG